MVQDRKGRTEVVQLRGRRNGPAPDGCAEALATYLTRRVAYLPPKDDVLIYRKRFQSSALAERKVTTSRSVPTASALLTSGM